MAPAGTTIPTLTCARRPATARFAAAVVGLVIALPLTTAWPAAALSPGDAPGFGAAVTLTGIGNAGGGSPMTSACAVPGVLTGVTGTLGGSLQSVRGTCRPITVTAAGDAQLGSAQPAAGQVLGAGSFPAAPPADCPAGSVVTGYSGRYGLLVDMVEPWCSPLGTDGTLGTSTASGAQIAGTAGGGSAIGPYLCPSGAVATSINGRAGDSVDFFSLSCRPLGFAPTEPGQVNTSWPTALRVGANSTTSSTIGASGQERWFAFGVQPGSTVQVDLTGLPADYDLTVFKDIGQAFTTLTSTTDLTQLSAEFAGDAFAPSVFSPSVFSPSVFSPSVFSPSVFSPSVFSPSVFSPSVFSPSVFSPSVFSPSVFSPSVFSPSVFSPAVSLPSVFSPSVFSPSVFSPSVFSAAFSSAQTRSLIGVSAHDGTAPESIRTATWNNTGDFYVRVQGRNGASAPGSFDVTVSTTGGPCGSTLDDHAGATTLTGTPGAATTVILTDLSRMSGTAAARSALSTTLSQFASSVGGVVVDLAASAKVHTLNAQADSPTFIDCPYAKTLTAQAIRDIVNSYRDTHGTLKYVVVVGDDRVVPFFRYADSAGLGPESGYVPPVAESTASQASLRSNYVLSQDAYGSQTDVSVKGATIPVPDLAVGRLVETPAEITATLQTYLDRSGAPITPASSLATGYDFLADAADGVAAEFAAGVGGTANDTLITDSDVSPDTTTVGGTPSRRTSWTAADLTQKLFGARHDLVFLAGHFSANSALAADYHSNVLTTQLAAAPRANFENTLVFSAGCHSGYNIVDDDGIPGVTVGLDWTQAFAQKGATLIAGTGYQYGDTDFLEYSERLYRDFAHELRVGTGAVPVGRALVLAKQDYLTGTTTLKGIDQKALLESTLYGLPMTGVDLPHGRVTGPTGPSLVSPSAVGTDPGQQLGLQVADLDVSPATQTRTKTLDSSAGGTVTTTYLEGPDGFETNPSEPVLPLLTANVTSPTGQVLRGVGFRSGSYSDTDGITPLTGAPATETASLHTPFVSPAFFPGRLATPNYYDALTPGGTSTTLLHITPAQHRSDAPGSLTDTLRRYTHLGLQLFFSDNISTYGDNTPALAGAPSITGVSSSNSAGAVTVSAHVVGDPSAGVQNVWVSFTGERGSPFHGTWSSVDLVQDPTDSTLWTGTIALTGGQQASAVRFLLQAANGVGLVGMDDNQGTYFTPGVDPGQASAGQAPTTLTLAPGATSGAYGGSLPVSATLATPSGLSVAGRPVTFALGGSSTTAFTNASGTASGALPLTGNVGGAALVASFDGDSTLRAASSAPRQVTVTKAPTGLALQRATDLPGVTGDGLVATLTGPGAVALREKAVYLLVRSAGGTLLAAVPTATDWRGRVQVPAAALPAAGVTFTASFGDAALPLPGGGTSNVADPSFGPSSASLTSAGVGTGSLAPALLGAAYSQPLALTGSGAPTLTATGLPPGITLTQSAGGSYALTGTPTRAGSYTVALTAGNGVGAPRTVTFTLVVKYQPSAFDQPVNDPPGSDVSTFNAKSTVPVKFALTDARGVLIPDAEAAAIASSCRATISISLVGSSSAPVGETVVTEAADSGRCFRYDGHQFHFNANSSNLGFAAKKTYLVTATVTSEEGDVLATHSVLVSFR